MSSQLRMTAYAALATMATATSLVTVFKSSAWVVPVMGAIIIVAASCALIRATPLPSVFEPLLAAVAILCWLTVLDARSTAHFGVIPGRLALRHLGHTARRGFTEVNKLPTPAVPRHGLVLLTVVGVAAVALVVDLLTVTLRRAALSGLPLLGLFTVCAATGHHGVGLVPFIAASTGYLWLLYADNREKVARWGSAVGTRSRARPASAWSTDPSSAPAPASLGRRVGAAAISISVIVPLLVPGLHTGIDKHSTGTGGSGGGNEVVLNPIVSVASELTSSKVVPLISYRSSSPDPGYLRLTSLDMFDGTTFSPETLKASARDAATDSLPVTPPAGPVVTTTISVSPNLALHWLPAPATATGVSVDKSWRYDAGTATVFSATSNTAGLRYTTKSVSNDPTSVALNSAGPPGNALDADLTVPASVPASVRKLTRSITATAGTPYDRALALQRFFTGGRRFTYDTSIKQDNSPNALADFLLHSRRGFCQQFATAMAVMARLSGIPSRVAVGFTRGTQQPDGSWLVTSHDAHAWPELYFPGQGWLAFEPTPRGDGQAVVPGYAKAAPLPGGHQANPSASPSTSASPGAVPPGLRPKPGVGSSGGSGGNAGGGFAHSTFSARHGWLPLLSLVVVMLLIAPGVSRVVVRRRRWRLVDEQPATAADAAWAELRDTAIDLHVPWHDGQTPRQIATALVTSVKADTTTRAALRRLADAEERSRYAPTPGDAGRELRDDVGVVRVAALATRSRWQHTAAVVLPRSILQTVAAGASRLGDRIERVNAALWRGVRRPRRRPGGRSVATGRP
jgi:transglutaminase-like putative cysteine protease